MSKSITPRGGARQGAGAPLKTFTKKQYCMRLADATVDRVERFARARGIESGREAMDRTVALETMIEEYCEVLDQIILPPKWKWEAFKRGGLKTLTMKRV